MHGRGHAWQGGVHGREACVAGGGCSIAGGCVAEVHGRGVCMAGWGACVAGEMATAAGGMHPTGMHSCFASKFSLVGSPTGN